MFSFYLVLTCLDSYCKGPPWSLLKVVFLEMSGPFLGPPLAGLFLGSVTLYGAHQARVSETGDCMRLQHLPIPPFLLPLACLSVVAEGG